jgi:dUTP pyrophosphatase
MAIKFFVKRLYDDALIPSKIYKGDAGFDVFSHYPDVVIGFGERVKIPLGFAMELRDGDMALIQEKSGMAVNDGILTIGNVIDSTYRGEVHAILCCLNQRPVTIKFGQKVAQMLIVPVYIDTMYAEVGELSPSERGEKGFGSSGL